MTILVLGDSFAVVIFPYDYDSSNYNCVFLFGQSHVFIWGSVYFLIS